MTLKSKKEYTKEVAKRYLEAVNRKEQTKILDEFCATAGYNRKYAIGKLRSINFKDPPQRQRIREKVYANETTGALIRIWKLYSRICAERLHPFIQEGLGKLEQFGHISLSASVKKELLAMSRATIGRRITVYQARFGKEHGLSATKPGSLLKKHIPIQTKSWDANRAGFMEADLVAHCGSALVGDFINTLQAVDIKTGWTERVAVMGKSQAVVFAGIKKIRTKLPFALLGIDSDNGSEFINRLLLNYCREEDISFTRSRPYMKKDNAHIEQKNWTLVRRILGYDRFDTSKQLQLINELYDHELRLYLNFFQPSLKLQSKERFGAKIKKTYDKAKTPYRRVMECSDIPEEQKAKLQVLYQSLDPVKLKRQIDKKIKNIVSLVRSGF